MIKKNILMLYNALNSLNNLSGVSFSYTVAKNIRILKPEIEALTEAEKPTEEFTKYEEERINLAKKYSKKDDEGESIIKDKKFVLENKKEFDKEFKKLKEENKEVLEGREKQVKEYLAVLETESSVELQKIDLSDVPDNITTNQMNSIYDIITTDKKSS